MSRNLEVKKQQALMVKDQVEIILKRYELSDADKDKIAKDVADVILTAWDLQLSDFSFANTWSKPEI
ncbi:hypothetical protein FJD32_025310 (plasmid) [Shewanella sp. LC6]|uniref:hypothetical protein n=1 Tax=unclassified Shewanella TaxID=196818 RepID=UPI0011298412|nr:MULTISPECIES: hypothetical protein [unclassified Shewanella]QQK62689.1 hypothetical protein FJD32_025310 [Shewanella sp. LC6]TPE64186.1 hypothetical protein FJD33_03550 [Shewanella sp. LC2]